MGSFILSTKVQLLPFTTPFSKLSVTYMNDKFEAKKKRKNYGKFRLRTREQLERKLRFDSIREKNLSKTGAP
jgi:hypothetical protein